MSRIPLTRPQDIAKNLAENDIKKSMKRITYVMNTYSSCLDLVENAGHSFGTDMSVKEKNDLTAFLLTI